MQLDRIAGFIGRFIQLHGNAVRTRRPLAFAVILPAVPCPEAYAADDIIRPFDFQAIGAPLDRETDFRRLPGREIERFLTFLKIFLIEL
ncbi:hypothetical protein SB00175_05177 [Klebsiella oxytoca]|nr:hypothetical protein SB00175_05177 [Klebsiella oxytoca]